MIQIHDIETNEIIERDFNEDELAQAAIDKKESQRVAKLEKDLAKKKAAILESLGLSQEDFDLLFN